MVKLTGKDLAFAYPGAVMALDGVDLELGQGELMCVIGPNGAGKSTLVQLLAGLLRPQRGSVSVDGVALRGLGARERARRIAVVPQGLRTVPEIDIESFVYGGRYSRLGFWGRSAPTGTSDRESVQRALMAADVAELGPRRLTDVSGGQRQRVLIARALAQETEVLLVDEPTSSLDPEHQLGVFSLIARLTCEGRAVLAVTHDLNLASQFATRIVLLADGRVAAAGPPSAVLTPAVLEPVYGRNLRFGSFDAPDGHGERPFVVSWQLPPGDASGAPRPEADA